MYINVNEFLNSSTDSDMIQAALDKARQTGAAVVIPKINRRTGKAIWDISKTIFLSFFGVAAFVKPLKRRLIVFVISGNTNEGFCLPSNLLRSFKKYNIPKQGT